MIELLQRYDVLGAFATTIELSALGAVGALVVGTVVAVMRVSPVATLRFLGTSYVNVVRNTPLTLLVVFSVLGMTYLLGLQLSPDVQTNAFRWVVVMLAVYHAAFVCEAIRSGFNTVPAGQSEAARSIGLTFGQSMREVILPQAFRGAVAPLGSTLIALIKNSTIAAVVGVNESANLMSVMIENETAGLAVFAIFAAGFVVLTLPLGLWFTSLSRRLAVQR